MSVRYAAVKWNANKRRYDAVIAAGVLLYLATFLAVGLLADMGVGPEVLLIRALGTCAYLLLHVVLCIGPLARFVPRLLPVLYNRRHLGVTTFLVGLAHAALATGYYHGFGRLHPLVSLLATNTNYASAAGFPFEILGVLALLILFLLGATSHDFWQKTLGPSAWKGLHLLIYPAYGLLVLHVAFGALQSEGHPAYVVLVALGFVAVAGLHLAAGWREMAKEPNPPGPPSLRGKGGERTENVVPSPATSPSGSPPFPRREGGPGGLGPSPWLPVAAVAAIPMNRARVVCLPGRERIAVFRHREGFSAVTNVCAHQRGPLGEGKIVDGCITCPWHGWEYRPENGQSPPPFQERIATYRVRVEGGQVWVHPDALPPGTPVEPARVEE